VTDQTLAVTTSPPTHGRRARRAAGAVVALALAATAAGSIGEVAAAQPVPGDTLVIGVQAPPSSLNPATVDVAFSEYTSIAYESLFYRAPDGTIQPSLAESWEYVGEGNTQFDITLRDGVTFTDGNPVDAEAVKASLEYGIGAGGSNAPSLAMVTSIEVTGPLTLSITMSAPNPMLPELLTPKYALGQIISPTGLADPEALTVENPSQGAGAYILNPGDTVAGDHYTYDANPDFFDPSRQHYEQIVIQVIADQQAAMNALQSGQIDITAGSAETVSLAEGAGLQIAQTPFVWQGLNLIDRGGEVSEPLGDVRVRQAVNYAIDRETVSMALLGEYGVPTATVTVEGGDGWSEAAATRYPYDPDMARQLLTEAGYPDGFELDVLSVRFAGIDLMAEAVAGQLAEVGIDVNLNHVTDVGAYIGGATDHSYPAVAVGYGAQPMFIMGPGLFLASAPIFNGFATDSPELAQLYADAAAAPPEERAALDMQMQQYLVDEAWFAPVAFSPVFYYARTDLGGLSVSPEAPTADPLDWYDTE
jgi:ABC-type transport system substrate-binding protein